MLEYIKYRYRLWKLRRGKSKLKLKYDSFIEEAKKDKDERESRIAEAMAFLRLEDQNIRELHTRYLRHIAKTIMVPLPDSKDESYWERDGYSPPILTEKGIYELNKSIRSEKKERREVIFSWVTIAIGLIGTLIGLISILKSK